MHQNYNSADSTDNVDLSWVQQHESQQTPSRLILAIALVVALVMVLAGLGIYKVLHSYSASSDSGVAACKTMAENAKKPKSDNNKTWTEDDYHKARKPFEDSRYTDIKVAGTNLVDTIYAMDKKSKDDTDLGGAMAMLTTINQQWSALQVACGNSGVELPGLAA